MAALITLIILYSLYLFAGLLITVSVYQFFSPLLDRRPRHRRSLREHNHNARRHRPGRRCASRRGVCR